MRYMAAKVNFLCDLWALWDLTYQTLYVLIGVYSLPATFYQSKYQTMYHRERYLQMALLSCTPK